MNLKFRISYELKKVEKSNKEYKIELGLFLPYSTTFCCLLPFFTSSYFLMIYINLPVSDLPKATAFYEALGFSKNPAFSNDDASALIWDASLSVMLLTHEFYKKFLPTGKVIADTHQCSAVLNALQFDTKEAVDAFFDKAITAGGKATIPTQDHGFMYGKDFEDIDGHIWEAFWMESPSDPVA